MSSFPNTNITFQAAESADLQFLLNLRKLTMSEYLIQSGLPNSDDYHLSRIQNSFKNAMLIMLGDQRIGVLTIEQHPSRLHIAQLQLLPAYQNKGLGSKLIRHLQNKANKRNVALTLNVMLVNPAIGLYLRLGFKVASKTDFDCYMIYQVNR